MKKQPGDLDRRHYGKVFNLQLEAQHAADKLPVVPGKRWGYFYANGTPETWAQKILAGDLSALSLGENMRPKAMIYDQSSIKDPEQLATVVPTVRASAYIATNTNLHRVAGFVHQCKDKALSIAGMFHLHDNLSENALYAQALRRMGDTGSKDIRFVAKNRAHILAAEIPKATGVDKVVKSLQLLSAVQDLRCGSVNLLEALKTLSPTEDRMVKELLTPYRQYVSSYDDASWKALIDPILAMLPARAAGDLEAGDTLVNPAPQPQTQPDPQDAVAPSEQDEYTTPPLPPDQSDAGAAESKEREPEIVIARVSPKLASQAPLGGYYITGRRSYYDRATKTWAKRKQLLGYIEKPLGSKHHVLTTTLRPGLNPIPLPNGYGLLPSSAPGLKFSEDQYGCIYAEATRQAVYKIEFGETEPTASFMQPILEDLEPLHAGAYEQNIEEFLRTIRGSNSEKAYQIAKWIKTNKSYPKDAHGVQHRLRSQSTGANYLPTLAAAPELECYSSANLFTDWARRSQVPARVVFGHMIDKAKKGQCLMTAKTGHAWVEIWTGQRWIRIDPTPPKRDKDDKGDQQDEQDPTESMDNEQDKKIDVTADESLADKLQKRQDARAQQMRDQVSDKEMQDAQQNMDRVREAMQQAQAKKEELERNINQSQSFEDLGKQEQAVGKADQLLEEMQEDLQGKLEQRKEEMKAELKDRLDQLADQGFMDDKDRNKLKEQIDKEQSNKELDKYTKRVDQEAQLERAYQEIVEEVRPLVDEWSAYFLDLLPKEKEPEVDYDILARSSNMNRRAVTKPRPLLTGLIKSPRVFEENPIPKCIFSIAVDVSGSMNDRKGALQEPKIIIALKTLVFFAELFSELSREREYIRFAVSIFSDSMKVIKDFDQSYDKDIFYEYNDGGTQGVIRTTVKARIMKAIKAGGGTNMLDALLQVGKKLSEVVGGDKEYISAVYVFGDGGDTCGNEARIRQLVDPNNNDVYGDHLYAASVLGDENDRRSLAALFGDKRTAVSDNFEDMVRVNMEQIQEDICGYLARRR